MRAATSRRYGGPEVLRVEHLERPSLKEDEVLVRVAASTVTSGDVRMRGFKGAGIFWLPLRLMLGLTKPRHIVPGMEFSGRIEAVGCRVRTFRVGDAVFGMTRGANAEFVVVPEKGLIASKPPELADAEAAATPFGALSALAFLVGYGQICRGQRILVYGASGAVGVFAVQIGKYFGCEVTGVCSSVNVDLVRSLGADKVIDYTLTDFTDSADTYDVILDTIGVTSFSRCRRILAPRGRHVFVYFQWPQILEMILTAHGLGQRVLCGFSSGDKNDFLLARAMVKSGGVRPVIDRTYDLQDIVDAHAYVETERKRGAVVVVVEDAASLADPTSTSLRPQAA